MDDIKKRIIYRSQYRGCKETDYLLGKFIQDKIEKFDKAELNIFNKLLEENDNNIYDWIMGRLDIPDHYYKLLMDIKEYHNLSN